MSHCLYLLVPTKKFGILVCINQGVAHELPWVRLGRLLGAAHAQQSKPAEHAQDLASVAMKGDWNGLTPAGHRRALEEDALHPSTYGQSPEAVKRLMFYYAESGTALAVRLPNSSLCDMTLVVNFLEKRLLPTNDDREEDRLMPSVPAPRFAAQAAAGTQD